MGRIFSGLGVSLLFFSVKVSAEVSDKCPSFLSRRNQNGDWDFLSADDAMIAFAQFTLVYAAICAALFYSLRWINAKWTRYPPLVISMLFAVFFFWSYTDKTEPCALQLLKEMPTPLFQIQILIDLLVVAIPLTMSGALKRHHNATGL